MSVTKEILIEALQTGAQVIHGLVRKKNDQYYCPGCPAIHVCGSSNSTGSCINDIVNKLIRKTEGLSRAKKVILK